MSDCINACEGLNINDNKYDLLISQLLNEVKELCKTSTAKFLFYDEKVAELCAYIKDNLTNSIQCLINDMHLSGEIDKLITDSVLLAYKELEIDVNDIKNVINDDKTDFKKGEIIDNLTISEDYRIYDLKGATVKNLIIDSIGATIKNATVLDCLVKYGSRNNVIKNIRFENQTQCIQFEDNTWAFNFVDCGFIGGGDGIAFNSGADNTNTTLLLTNCYFYNFVDIIRANGGTVLSIIGGWGDNIKNVVHFTENAVTEIVINGYDFEQIETAVKCDKFIYANLFVNGIIGITNNAIVDYKSGAVNLTADINKTETVNLFSNNSPNTHYCNIPTVDGANYRFMGSEKEYNVTFKIPPLSTVQVLNNLYVNKIDFDTLATYDVYTNYGLYQSGSTLNSITPIYIKNKYDGVHTVTLNIKTPNVIAL